MQYSGNLDLHQTWERTFRRAGLPLAYTQGHNPHPRLNLASALPLGFTGEGELLDAWMEKYVDIEDARAALEETMPPGLMLYDLEIVPESQPALQTQVLSADYRVSLPPTISSGELDNRIDGLLEATELRRKRRDKEYDLRPLIEDLARAMSTDEGHIVHMRLSTREGATGRPEEVVAALNLPNEDVRYHRVRLELVKLKPPVVAHTPQPSDPSDPSDLSDLSDLSDFPDPPQPPTNAGNKPYRSTFTI